MRFLEEFSQKMNDKINDLKSLSSHLQTAVSISEKIAILNEWEDVKSYFSQKNPFLSISLSLEAEYVVKAIVAIGQGPIVFNMNGVEKNYEEPLNTLVNQLIEIENFYIQLGGIVGYYLTFLDLIKEAKQSTKDKNCVYLHPEGVRIDQKNHFLNSILKKGLENLPMTAEIYPVGGAGDRLNLKDEKTDTPLPSAILEFNGRSLIEELIRDLQAREYLYFKLFGEQLSTPIGLMTSEEKNNHQHILDICHRCQWFGKSPKSFFIFRQPLVPVITINGDWSLSAPLKLNLKPGGHGVIWKLAKDKGLFDWLNRQGYKKSLIRQINNPIAGIDDSLVALIGLGTEGNRAMGFVSCERLLNTAEGTNVLIEVKQKENFSYCITNIEYTEFSKKGIADSPTKPGSLYSAFPSNTNILFVDIASIIDALKICDIPGKLINLKTKVPFRDAQGNVTQIEGGRLESTMQNIADFFVDTFPKELTKEKIKQDLRTFIAFNERKKTISTTKVSYHPGESPIGTPEQAYYDVLLNNRELFAACSFALPSLNAIEEYLENGPSFNISYHPALGPFYSIIQQKIRKGRLNNGSELILEIAEVDIHDLDINGSVIITAKEPLGYKDANGILKYGRESRCRLHHIVVNNKGINYHSDNIFWKNHIQRKETLKIILNEGAEFFAENVVFSGSYVYEVPAFHSLKVWQDEKGEIHKELKPITQPTWAWKYSFGHEDSIQLRK